LARKLGADHVVNARAVDPVAEIRRLSVSEDGAAGVDHSFDATGRADNVARSLAAVRSGIPGRRRGGALVLVGVIRTVLELPGMELLNGQKQVVGCLGGDCIPDRDFPVFAQWGLEGLLDLDAMVTNRYTLDQVNEAVEDLRSGKVLGRAVIDL
jgi:Zn-dependent alcohol dehydrogenase